MSFEADNPDQDNANENVLQKILDELVKIRILLAEECGEISNDTDWIE